MKDRTLIKTKIVLTDNGKGLVTYFWKKTFWIFGYWYPYGCCSSSNKISQSKIAKINDSSISKVLFDEFINNF